MDTPASAVMICCLFALVGGQPSPSKIDSVSGPDLCRIRNSQLGWTFLCGCLLGLTYATRGLTALVIPCFAVAVWRGASGLTIELRLQYLMALASGIAVSLAVFFIAWYQPHHSEIERINRYYVIELLLPGSVLRLQHNIQSCLFDYQRGAMPYLMRHSPVQFCLAAACIAWTATTISPWQNRPNSGPLVRTAERSRPVLELVAGWMAVYFIFLCCVNYGPSRYFVLFYPAMAALSAYALFETPRILSGIVDRKVALALLGSYLICLTGQALRSRLVLISARDMYVLFCGIAAALYIGSALQRVKPRPRTHRSIHSVQQPGVWIAGLLLWAIVNGYWSSDWLLHLSYRQKQADRWLAANLPAHCTLIGALAPGLCLNNRFKAVNVISSLCNDGPVVEQASPPRYIVMLDGGDWREHWWDVRYPSLVSPLRKVHEFPHLLRPFFHVSLYSVDDSRGQIRPSLYLRR